MKTGLVIIALAVLGFTATASFAADGIESRVNASEGWVGYHVPMVSGANGPCCYTIRDGAATKRGCDLDGRGWNFGTSDSDARVAHDDALAVYLHVGHGHVERVRAVAASCPVHTASEVRWIDPVEADASVALLSSLIDRDTSGDPDDHGLVALAYHAAPSATRAISALAEPSHPRRQREQALFWLGQARGAEGADIIEHYATTDADPKLREQAIFALSQSSVPDAYPHIVTIARNDPADHVRSQALFWMAQMNDARAKGDIVAALKRDTSSEVREQAVFALSELEDGTADDALIEVLKGDYPRAIKKQALFWLGQSGSPRAMAYFDEALK